MNLDYLMEELNGLRDYVRRTSDPRSVIIAIMLAAVIAVLEDYRDNDDSK